MSTILVVIKMSAIYQFIQIYLILVILIYTNILIVIRLYNIRILIILKDYTIVSKLMYKNMKQFFLTCT